MPPVALVWHTHSHHQRNDHVETLLTQRAWGDTLDESQSHPTEMQETGL